MISPKPEARKLEIDLRIRVAELEKDLLRCRGEKAEAEIAVQYLAQLNATNAAKALREEKFDVQIAILKTQLDQAIQEKEKLQSQLTLINNVFLSFATSQGKSSDSVKIRATRPAEDLINLVDASEESGTLVDEPLKVIDPKRKDHENVPAESITSDTTDSRYIVHFNKSPSKTKKNQTGYREGDNTDKVNQVFLIDEQHAECIQGPRSGWEIPRRLSGFKQ